MTQELNRFHLHTKNGYDYVHDPSCKVGMKLGTRVIKTINPEFDYGHPIGSKGAIIGKIALDKPPAELLHIECGYSVEWDDGTITFATSEKIQPDPEERN